MKTLNLLKKNNLKNEETVMKKTQNFIKSKILSHIEINIERNETLTLNEFTIKITNIIDSLQIKNIDDVSVYDNYSEILKEIDKSRKDEKYLMSLMAVLRLFVKDKDLDLIDAEYLRVNLVDRIYKLLNVLCEKWANKEKETSSVMEEKRETRKEKDNKISEKIKKESGEIPKKNIENKENFEEKNEKEYDDLYFQLIEENKNKSNPQNIQYIYGKSNKPQWVYLPFTEMSDVYKYLEEERNRINMSQDESDFLVREIQGIRKRNLSLLDSYRKEKNLDEEKEKNNESFSFDHKETNFEDINANNIDLNEQKRNDLGDQKEKGNTQTEKNDDDFLGLNQPKTKVRVTLKDLPLVKIDDNDSKLFSKIVQAYSGSPTAARNITNSTKIKGILHGAKINEMQNYFEMMADEILELPPSTVVLFLYNEKLRLSIFDEYYKRKEKTKNIYEKYALLISLIEEMGVKYMTEINNNVLKGTKQNGLINTDVMNKIESEQKIIEITKKQTLIDPNTKRTPIRYTKTFIEFMQEQNLVIPDEAFETEQNLLAVFGEDKKQILNGCPLAQFRSEVPYEGALEYYGALFSLGLYIYTPHIWLDYTTNCKTVVAPGEKIFKYYDETNGLSVLARTTMSHQAINNLIAKGNRASFVGTALYIINNPDKLERTTPDLNMISFERILDDAQTYIAGSDKNLLEKGNDITSYMLRHNNVQNFRMFDIFQIFNSLDIMKNKYDISLIEKVFSDPKISSIYKLRFAEEEDANQVPYISPTEVETNILMSTGQIIQKLYNKQRDSTINDIINVFPKQSLEEYNKKLLLDIIQMANYSNDRDMAEFYKNVLDTCHNSFNGAYSAETSILRHVQVYTESAINQYNRMNFDERIEKQIKEMFHLKDNLDLNETNVLSYAVEKEQQGVDDVLLSFDSNDIILRLTQNENFLNDFFEFMYFPPSDNVPVLKHSIVEYVEDFIKIEGAAYKLVSVNKNSKGIVVNKVKRSETWISELQMADYYFENRHLYTNSEGSYCFSKVKNEVQDRRKLPRNFQTMLAYTQAHGQMLGTIGKAHIKRVDQGGVSLIGYPLMGQAFNTLIKQMEEMTMGETFMFSFSDNLYIVQKTEDGNIVYYSLDLVKGESSTYIGTMELLYKSWIHLFGDKMDSHYMDFAKLFLYDQVNMKAFIPAGAKKLYLSNTRYLPSGSCITTECNHLNSTLLIYLTQKLKINPIIKKDTDYVISPDFIELAKNLGMRFEVGYSDQNLFKNISRTNCILEGKVVVMDMLGFDAVKVGNVYMPILNYKRYLKQICFNKSGEVEGVDKLYDYMRYRALLMSGYLYKHNTFVYKHLLGQMHNFSYRNLELTPEKLIQQMIEMNNTVDETYDTRDYFYNVTAKPYLDTMKYMLPPGVLQIISIMAGEAYSKVMEQSLVKKYTSQTIDITPIDFLTLFGDIIYEDHYKGIYDNISSTLDVILNPEYSKYMLKVKNVLSKDKPKVVIPTVHKYTQAVYADNQIIVSSKELNVRAYDNDSDYNIIVSALEGTLSDHLKNMKILSFLHGIVRVLYLLSVMRCTKEDKLVGVTKSLFMGMFKEMGMLEPLKMEKVDKFPFIKMSLEGVNKKYSSGMLSDFFKNIGVKIKDTKCETVIRNALFYLKNLLIPVSESDSIDLEIYRSFEDIKRFKIRPDVGIIMFIKYGKLKDRSFSSFAKDNKGIYSLIKKSKFIFSKVRIVRQKFTSDIKMEGIQDLMLMVWLSSPYKVNKRVSKDFNYKDFDIVNLKRYYNEKREDPVFKQFSFDADKLLSKCKENLNILAGEEVEQVFNEIDFGFDKIKMNEAFDIYDECNDIGVPGDLPDRYYGLAKLLSNIGYNGMLPHFSDAMGISLNGVIDDDISLIAMALAQFSFNPIDRLVSYYIYNNRDDLPKIKTGLLWNEVIPTLRTNKNPLFNPKYIQALKSFLTGNPAQLKTLVSISVFNVSNINNLAIEVDLRPTFSLESVKIDGISLGRLSALYNEYIRSTKVNNLKLKEKDQNKVSRADIYRPRRFRDIVEPHIHEEVNRVVGTPINFHKADDYESLVFEKNLLEEKISVVQKKFSIDFYKNRAEKRLAENDPKAHEYDINQYKKKREEIAKIMYKEDKDIQEKIKNEAVERIKVIEKQLEDAKKVKFGAMMGKNHKNLIIEHDNNLKILTEQGLDKNIPIVECRYNPSSKIGVSNDHQISFFRNNKKSNAILEISTAKKNPHIKRMRLLYQWNAKIGKYNYVWDTYFEDGLRIEGDLSRITFDFHYVNLYMKQIYYDHTNTFINIDPSKAKNITWENAHMLFGVRITSVMSLEDFFINYDILSKGLTTTFIDDVYFDLAINLKEFWFYYVPILITDDFNNLII